MSSFNRKDRPLFVVQSGVVAWEEPEPIPDWQRKTVSIVSRTLPVAIDLVWAIFASRPQRINRVFRFYLAPISPSITAAQKRRLLTDLKTDPPGFTDTILRITDTHACVTSTLCEPSTVDFGFLSAYRRCALVELDDSHAPGNQAFLDRCGTVTDLGAAAIGSLLARAEVSVVWRVLELESYVVIQLIGAPGAIDSAITCLVDRDVRRFHDLRALPQEIASLRE